MLSEQFLNASPPPLHTVTLKNMFYAVTPIVLIYTHVHMYIKSIVTSVNLSHLTVFNRHLSSLKPETQSSNTYTPDENDRDGIVIQCVDKGYPTRIWIPDSDTNRTNIYKPNCKYTTLQLCLLIIIVLIHYFVAYMYVCIIHSSPQYMSYNIIVYLVCHTISLFQAASFN